MLEPSGKVTTTGEFPALMVSPANTGQSGTPCPVATLARRKVKEEDELTVATWLCPKPNDETTALTNKILTVLSMDIYPHPILAVGAPLESTRKMPYDTHNSTPGF
jgi:hypothetical protein